VSKGLDQEANRRLRAITRRVMAERFGGSQSKAAQAFNVEQGFLSDFLNEKRGAGAKLLRGLAKFDPSVGDIIGLPTRVVEQQERYTNREHAIRLIVQDSGALESDVRAAADAAGTDLKSEDDLSVVAWVDAIREWLRALRLNRQRTGARPVSRREATAEADATREAFEAALSPPAKRKKKGRKGA
jgi:hypothetical protein